MNGEGGLGTRLSTIDFCLLAWLRNEFAQKGLKSHFKTADSISLHFD